VDRTQNVEVNQQTETNIENKETLVNNEVSTTEEAKENNGQMPTFEAPQEQPKQEENKTQAQPIIEE
jgi:hypothetical protein